MSNYGERTCGLALNWGSIETTKKEPLIEPRLILSCQLGQTASEFYKRLSSFPFKNVSIPTWLVLLQTWIIFQSTHAD